MILNCEKFQLELLFTRFCDNVLKSSTIAFTDTHSFLDET